MYALVTCDRPGCSKVHKVIAARSGRLGAALTGPQRPDFPESAHPDTVSLPLPLASGDVDTHSGTPAGVRPAR